VVEKSGDLHGAQLARVALAMKMDETPDPVNIGLLRADAVMLEPDSIPHGLKQARWFRGIQKVVCGIFWICHVRGGMFEEVL
jgi:hypothetical protein